ncbi:MAG TPA: SusD/RagB family nutrient-binding outer membrane lipoprotein [Puia sp.]|nr:SusD/RagB family nutrient-binding outer membrane lipoprotein [Puia sp.]
MKFQKILFYICSVCVLGLGACTKKFDAINTDPTQASASQFDPNLLLSGAETGYFIANQGYNGPILFQSMWVQTFASAAYPSYYSNGDKYVGSSNLLDYQGRLWTRCYNSASYCYEIQNLTKGVASLVNLRGIALILQLHNLEVLTDVYGDIPYSQALRAKEGISQPVYDKQQDIYTSMLARLDSVLPTLDPAKDAPKNDAWSYKGDVAKWKRFGYSLMLRMAMRLTKADATTAQKYAEKAAAGGTMTDNGDNLYQVFDQANGYGNNNSSALVVPEDYSEVRWGKVLIDYLKSTTDPRLPVIAEVPQAGIKNAANESLPGISTAASQNGMPSGRDQNGGATDISTAPGYPGGTGTGTDFNKIGNYSRPTSAVYIPLNTPGFVITYAQTQFLLAETAARGWSAAGSAATHYKNALSASLQTYGTLNAAGTISAAVADAYATAHPLDVSTPANSIQQINMQYWVLSGTIMEYVEAWANWRRSGFPVLTSVNYVGNFTAGVIPRRQAYPVTEAATNPKNYTAAVTALTGGDVYASKVWWDK